MTFLINKIKKIKYHCDFRLVCRLVDNETKSYEEI